MRLNGVRRAIGPKGSSFITRMDGSNVREYSGLKKASFVTDAVAARSNCCSSLPRVEDEFLDSLQTALVDDRAHHRVWVEAVANLDRFGMGRENFDKLIVDFFFPAPGTVSATRRLSGIAEELARMAATSSTFTSSNTIAGECPPVPWWPSSCTVRPVLLIAFRQAPIL